MTLFNLKARVSVSIYTQVEAETLEEAIRESEKRNVEAAEYSNDQQELDVWVYDEIDGMPSQIAENED